MSNSHRLQVLIPGALEARLTKAAQRARLSKGEWVRRAIESALRDPESPVDALSALSSLGAPTGDIDQILDEIESGKA